MLRNATRAFFPNMLKNVIFDWSGVVHNNIAQTCKAINFVLHNFNVPEMSVAEIRENWIQPYMQFYTALIPGLDIQREQELFYLCYKEEIKTNPTAPFSGLPELLRLFKAAGLKMIIISSDHPSTLFNDLDNYGLNGIFDEVYADVHDKRVGLKEILTKHNFVPNETVFIGDSTHEVESARSVGLLSCAVTWGFQNKDKLLAAAPDFMADTVAELKNIILHRHAPTPHVLGVKIDGPNFEKFVDKVIVALKSNRPWLFFTPNPEMVVKAQTDDYFKNVLNAGDVNVCDGMGLYLAARYKGYKVSRLTGVDGVLILAGIAARTNRRIFFLGSGSEMTILKAARYLLEKFPKLPLCGLDKGPVIVENKANKLVIGTIDSDQLAKKIIAAEPEILVVGFGMGKQEKWIYENVAKFPSVKIAIGVGGAFDYISGKVPRAPLLMRKIGLEWVYRLIREPRRAGRIFNATIKFLWLILKNK